MRTTLWWKERHPGLQLRDSESALRSQRSRWDSSWWDARRAGSKNWVCERTKVAGICTKSLPNRPADSEADGSGAAAAEWPGPVRYGASAHRLMNSMKNSYKSYINSLYFSRYFPRYSSDLISNMISPMKRGQNPWYLARFHEKPWILVYQEVSESSQRIHIRIHIWIHEKNMWFRVYQELLGTERNSVPSSKNSDNEFIQTCELMKTFFMDSYLNSYMN